MSARAARFDGASSGLREGPEEDSSGDTERRIRRRCLRTGPQAVRAVRAADGQAARVGASAALPLPITVFVAPQRGYRPSELA
ncbi:hypothetical protein [Streptomyces sp. NPDC093544]|uniref:hypothetical protein n=1 Tax=Streptomyces sp. NPDC093544 TaxID=3155200 RepID=UPI00344569D2